MYTNASNSTPSCTQISLYMVWRVHLLGTITSSSMWQQGRECHALITPNFSSSSCREIAIDYVQKIDVGPSFFTLLRLAMLADGARSDWGDQPLHPACLTQTIATADLSWYLWQSPVKPKAILKKLAPHAFIFGKSMVSRLENQPP